MLAKKMTLLLHEFVQGEICMEHLFTDASVQCRVLILPKPLAMHYEMVQKQGDGFCSLFNLQQSCNSNTLH